MDLSQSRRVSPRVEWRNHAGSTNAELITEVQSNPDEWPHLSCLVTDNQTEGRGRLSRSWIAPAGTALALSVFADVATGPRAITTELLGWVPLAAGLAMVRALRPRFADDQRVALKWPNDVLVDGKKVCGILSELTPRGIIVGTGVNLTMTEDDLPTPEATSLQLSGATDHDIDGIVADYLTELDRLLILLAGGDRDSVAKIVRDVSAVCSTLSRHVRVELPGGVLTEGTAECLDAQGRLVVETAKDYPHLVVAAGDVTHLRVLTNHDSSSGDGAHHSS